MKGLAQHTFFGNGGRDTGKSGLGYSRKEDLTAVEHLTVKHGHR